MKPQDLTYDLCRSYVQDRKSTIPDNVYDYLLGNLRSRNINNLVSCVNLFALDVTWAGGMRTLHQVESFFRKNTSFTDPEVARLSALVSFEDAEQQCATTNNRLDSFYAEPHIFDTRLHLWVSRSQRYINKVLGKHSDFLNELPKLVRFTAGATVERSRKRAMPYLKVSSRMSCTPGAMPYIDALAGYFGFQENMGYKLFSGNRIVFVPKSWKTERTIACESTGNMCLQLAFDRYSKIGLHRMGIDLSDQTKNQDLAKEGSIDGSLATIDFSMASDTVAYNTVALLYPMEWFRYLRAIRSSNYEMYRGSKQNYHKFSSMGNGSTFTIETMIFSAACYAVGSKRFSVYGDDVIIETELVDDLLTYLTFLGFTINMDKSFSTGPFRESCGKYWFHGVDITPFCLREMDTRKTVLSHIVNNCVAISPPFGETWKLCKKLCVLHNLPVVPVNSDSMNGVHVSAFHAYSRKLIRTRNWIPKFKALVPKAERKHRPGNQTWFLWWLHSLFRKEGEDLISRDFRVMLLNKDARMVDRFNEKYQSSWYTLPAQYYVRKWVHWIPVANESDHVYTWSDYLIPYIPKPFVKRK